MPNKQGIPQVNQVQIPMPLKGVVRVPSREQPVGEGGHDFVWDALNIVPYDRYGRARVAQRGGLIKQYTQDLTSTGDPTFIQGMIEAPNIVYPGQTFSTQLGGLSNIPGYAFSFSTSAVGADFWSGPSVSWNSPWIWNFTITSNTSSYSTVPTTYVTPVVVFFAQIGVNTHLGNLPIYMVFSIQCEQLLSLSSTLSTSATINLYKTSSPSTSGTWGLTNSLSLSNISGTTTSAQIIIDPMALTTNIVDVSGGGTSTGPQNFGFTFFSISPLSPTLNWLSTFVQSPSFGGVS